MATSISDFSWVYFLDVDLTLKLGRPLLEILNEGRSEKERASACQT